MSAPEQEAGRAQRLERAILAKRTGPRARALDILPRPAGEAARLDDLQRGLWFVHMLEPESPAYNLCSAFRVSGTLDVPKLQRAFETVVSRHRLLRSTFRADGDTALQIVHHDAQVALGRVIAEDGGGLDAAVREAARPFDLGCGPLVRLLLVEEPGGRTRYLVLVVHHILADEQSLGTLWTELADLYDDGGRFAEETGPTIQYDDYIHWLSTAGRSRREEDLAFWRRRLAPRPEELRLPFERQRPVDGGRGRLIERTAVPSIQKGIRRLAAASGATPFMVSAFSFALLLHRYTQGQPIAFGTPVSTRSHPAAAEMIGYFLNPVVIGTALDEQERVGPAVAAFSLDVRDALAHASAPFDRLAAELSPRRHVDRHPIFQVMFVYQVAGPAPALGEARLEPVRLDLGASKFDLTLFVTEGEGALQTAVEFRSDRFDDTWMHRLLDHYEMLLDQVPRDLDRLVCDVPLLGTDEQCQLSAWERGAPLEGVPPVLLPQQIEDRARRHPQHAAVACGPDRCDYGTLESAARAIAYELARSGVGPNDRVGVFFHRSVQMIAALLGTHLAGAAYVPLDPAYPDARNRELLEDAAVAAVLTTAALRGRLPAGAWRPIAVDALDDSPDRSAMLPGASPACPAYILYTSGSTGRPKGVVVTHDNLRLSTFARMQAYDAPPVRFLLLPGLAFDSSVAGIFWTLAAGGTLVVPTESEAKDVRSLARLVADAGVTTLLCVPSLYAQLLGTSVGTLHGLATVIVAGERCPSQLAADHLEALPHVRLFNEYGPTEATVWATVHEVTQQDASRPVPIGRPIPGVRLEVLDGQGRRVPAGIPGHGWIAGPTVADGYWRRDDLTAERFFAGTGEAGTAGRRYRTGDRMAWTEDGSLLFLGRDDDQIKLRGYRVEPGEIEAALLEHPAIAQVAVVARGPGGEAGSPADAASTQLVAFAVASSPGAVHGWREALAARLPEHMIPARLVTVAGLERLPNGKVDRRRLQELPIPAAVRVAAEERVPDAREQALISLWEGLLGRFGIDATDNLFELGGHSLLVIQMVAAMERDFEVRLSAADVFQHPTVRDLARRIGERSGHGAPAYEQLFPIQPTGRRTPFIMAAPAFFAAGLATRFRGERPVYGVRGIGVRAEGNRGRWPTLRHLAEDVVNEIRRRFPDERYLVAGYSFGAWLAIEIARVMEIRGLPLHRLYLIAPMPADFYRVGPFRVRIDGLRQPLADLGAADVLRLWARSNHPLTRAPYRRARQLLTERPWRRLLSALGSLRRRAGLPVGPRLLHADVRAERFRLHAGYTPGLVRAATVFFNPAGTASDAAATWRPYLLGPLAVHSIPDPHDAASVAAARDVVLRHLEIVED